MPRAQITYRYVQSPKTVVPIHQIHPTPLIGYQFVWCSGKLNTAKRARCIITPCGGPEELSHIFLEIPLDVADYLPPSEEDGCI